MNQPCCVVGACVGACLIECIIYVLKSYFLSLLPLPREKWVQRESVVLQGTEDLLEDQEKEANR